MKKMFCGLLLLILLFELTPTTYAAPLIFKTKKVIEQEGFTEIATVDTSRFRKIRISIYQPTEENNASIKSTTYRGIGIFAIEDDQEFSIDSKLETYVQWNTIIDMPPAKLRFKVNTKGTVYLYIWAVD